MFNFLFFLFKPIYAGLFSSKIKKIKCTLLVNNYRGVNKLKGYNAIFWGIKKYINCPKSYSK